MSKGSHVRPYNRKKFGKEYDRIFGVKELNVWEDAPPKGEDEESCPGCGGSGCLEGPNHCPCREEDANGIQGDTGDGTRDWSDGGRIAYVPQEPGGAPDSQAAEPVESPPRGNRQAPLDLHPLDTAYWIYSGYRGEFNCPHGVGHGNHIHGCCHKHCCTRDDFPLRKDK
jgi:hypothetical protein